MTAEIISAFTEEQAKRLTGVTVHRLRHWDRTGFFVPSLASAERRLPYSRVYSFRDLLSLQVLKSLRDDEGCSLQYLRQVRDVLSHLGDDLWSRKKLYVFNKKVVLGDAIEEDLHEPVTGQRLLRIIPLKEVRSNMEQSVKKMTKRQPSDHGRIDRRRNVSHNAPVIAGTRITVGAVKRLKEDGFSVDQIMAEYPSLTAADIEAALKYRDERKAA